MVHCAKVVTDEDKTASAGIGNGEETRGMTMNDNPICGGEVMCGWVAPLDSCSSFCNHVQSSDNAQSSNQSVIAILKGSQGRKNQG